MMRVLTDVYPPEIKPVRDGLYVTFILDDSGTMSLRTIRLWCGSFWCYEWEEGVKCPSQKWHWQGLAFDPAAAVLCLDRVTDLPGVFLPGATC